MNFLTVWCLYGHFWEWDFVDRVLFMLDKVFSEKGSNHNWRISKIAMGLNMSEFIRVSGRESRPKFERIHAEGLCDCLASPTFVPLLSIPGKTCWSNWLMRYILAKWNIYIEISNCHNHACGTWQGKPPKYPSTGGFPLPSTTETSKVLTSLCMKTSLE